MRVSPTRLGPPSKRITVPDVIIIVATGGLGLFGGTLWSAILCGCAMAVTIALWRVLWYLGALFDSSQADVRLRPRESEPDSLT